MRVLISDKNEREDNRYTDKLQNHTDVVFIDHGRWQEASIDLTNFDIIFQHDSLWPKPSESLSAEALAKITLIELGGGGTRQNELREPEGFKFKAEIADPSQANLVLEIIDKLEVTLDDVMLILRFDPELERLLEPFAKANPFETEPEVIEAKGKLNAYVNTLI